jgi:hypothetical protein
MEEGKRTMGSRNTMNTMAIMIRMTIMTNKIKRFSK